MEGAILGLQGIFEVLFIIGLGFVLARKGWFNSASSALLTRFIMRVSLPLYLFCNIQKDFTHESLLAMAPDLVLPFGSIILAYIIGRVAAKVLHISRGRQGLFIDFFFIANTMFIGLPVNLALFGNQSVPSVMLYYMANTVMFWTLGVYHIVNDTKEGAENMPLFSLQSIKKVFSPPLMAFLIGLTLTLLSIRLPSFVLTSFQYVGNIATPMSLIVIGIEISLISMKEIHWDRDVIGALIGRFIICPGCVLLLLPFIPVTDMSAKVFTMQASMPAMTQMTIVAKSVGADVKYATTVSFISIILGMLVIPIYMIIVG